MCGPPAIALAGAAIAATGSIVGGLQANAMGKYQQRVAEQNAALDRERINMERENSAREAQNYWRKVAQLKGQQRTHAAGSNVSTDFGSAAQIVMDTDLLAREDADLIYRGSAERIKGLDRSVSNNIAQGNAARSQGRGALIGSAFSAASSVLGGVSQYNKLSVDGGGKPLFG